MKKNVAYSCSSWLLSQGPEPYTYCYINLITEKLFCVFVAAKYASVPVSKMKVNFQEDMHNAKPKKPWFPR